MDETMLETSKIIALGVALLIVILVYINLHYKVSEKIAEALEDLANTYTPEILKPRPLKPMTTPDEPIEEPKEE